MTKLHLNIEHTVDGMAFFKVYNVIGRSKKNGEQRSLHVFASHEGAKDYTVYAKPVYEKLYDHIWIKEEIVWFD